MYLGSSILVRIKICLVGLYVQKNDSCRVVDECTLNHTFLSRIRAPPSSSYFSLYVRFFSYKYQL